MTAKAVDEGGHMSVPAHRHVPPESERHAERGVEATKRLDRKALRVGGRIAFDCQMG